MRAVISIFSIGFLCGISATFASDVSIVTNSGESEILHVQDSALSDYRVAIAGYSDGEGLSPVGVYGEAFGSAGIGLSGYGAYYALFAYGSQGNAAFFYGDINTSGDSWADHHYDYSDATVKLNIQDLSPSLSKIMQLRPKTYQLDPNFTKKKTPSKEEIGLIAQDVEEVFPQLVSTVSTPNVDGKGKLIPKSSNTYKGLNYDGLVPVLIKAMQEQNARIDSLQTEMAVLKAGK